MSKAAHRRCVFEKNEVMIVKIPLIALTLCMFMTTAAAQQKSPNDRSDGVKAYDLGANGKDKLATSIRLPVATGGHVLRSKDAVGLVVFGERLALSGFYLRIPVATLEGLEPAKDAEVAAAVGLDGKKDPYVFFESTSVVADRKEPSLFRIRGKVTLKGITKDAVFEGTLIELQMPGARERGFIGDVLHVKLAAKLNPADFAIAVPKPEKDADPQEMNIKIDAFAMTNDKPSRDRVAAIEAILRPAPAESRPAETPASQPTKKN